MVAADSMTSVIRVLALSLLLLASFSTGAFAWDSDDAAFDKVPGSGGLGVQVFETHLELGPGMSFRDITKRMGPAAEKVEYESKRWTLWRYASSDLLFEQGRLLRRADPPPSRAVSGALRDSRGVLDSEAYSTISRVPHGTGAVSEPRPERISREAERVLSEILREIPSNPDSASEGSFPSPGAIGNVPSRAPGLVRPYSPSGSGLELDDMVQ